MPRKKKETPQFSEDAVAAERQRILAEMPTDRDLTDAETTAYLRRQRAYMLADLTATAKFDPDPKRRDAATKELLAQDVGKAGAKKRTEADQVGVVIMERGKYGIPA